MNSLLIKRLPGILALGLVTLAVGAAGSPASAATSSGAHISALTNAQVAAKKRALRACAKKSTAKRRRACRRAVIRKYNRLANALPPGKTTTVLVKDDFFTPGSVDIKVNDSIEWSWAEVGGFEPHNVVLTSGPSGVSRDDYNSGQPTVAKGTRFKRTFIKTGTYSFVCSIHSTMTMSVNVSN